jgi:small subunit ribosomal protein S8
MSVDSMGDFLTIIRNGVLRGKAIVSAPFSAMRHSIALTLQEEGYVKGVSVDGSGVCKRILLSLKYVNNESVIHEIGRVSKPGRRTYRGAKNISLVAGGTGISILTTSSGILTGKRAMQIGVGGEVVCIVW